MKAVLLTRDAPDQRALAAKLTAVGDVVGIVLSSNVPRKPPRQRYRILFNRLMGRVVARPLLLAWRDSQARYAERYERFPDIPVVRVRNVNDEETALFLRAVCPEIILVSSTNLVGREIINWANTRAGILNLHTGLAPYFKGGPNCTNWCLAEAAVHAIGNTILWLDKGIDSGALAATELTTLSGSESLSQRHLSVLEHGQDLFARAFATVVSRRPLSRVPQQQIGEGRTYYTAQWGPRPMRRAVRNFHRLFTPENVASESFRLARSRLRLVSLTAS